MDFKQHDYYNELCCVAQSKGGKVTSLQYDNSETYMTFQCQHGHQWQTQAKRVKAGTWCPVYAKRNP